MDIALSGDALVQARLLGANDENFKAIEARYPVTLSVKDGVVRVSGPDPEPVRLAGRITTRFTRQMYAQLWTLWLKEKS